MAGPHVVVVAIPLVVVVYLWAREKSGSITIMLSFQCALLLLNVKATSKGASMMTAMMSSAPTPPALPLLTHVHITYAATAPSSLSSFPCLSVATKKVPGFVPSLAQDQQQHGCCYG